MKLFRHQYASFIERIRTLRIILLVFAFSGELDAQDWPGFKNLRYEEDYSFLEKDTCIDLYKQLKWRRIKGTILSAGGEFRAQYFNIHNEDFGSTAGATDGFLLSRFLLHHDTHTKRFRFFSQLQGGEAFLKKEISPIDENKLDVHQLFVDYKLVSRPSVNITFRAGRQELLYGFQRLISVRDGPNYRQAFDGFKIKLDQKSIGIDAFYTHHVSIKRGIFNDNTSSAIKLWGMYGSRKNIAAGRGLDIYYIGYQRQQARFENASGLETRHSFGLRMSGDSEKHLHDIEFISQHGKVGGQLVSAWTASVDVALRFPVIALKPEFGLKTELISGDRHATDSIAGTFNAMFPRGGYFGLAAQFGPSNLFDIHPSVQLTLLPTLFINLDYDMFWRYSTSDGLYTVSGTMVYSAGRHLSRYIGDQFSIEIAAEPNRFFSLSVEGKWFEVGKFLKQVSPGKNILFIMTEMRFRF